MAAKLKTSLILTAIQNPTQKRWGGWRSNSLAADSAVTAAAANIEPGAEVDLAVVPVSIQYVVLQGAGGAAARGREEARRPTCSSWRWTD